MNSYRAMPALAGPFCSLMIGGLDTNGLISNEVNEVVRVASWRELQRIPGFVPIPVTNDIGLVYLIDAVGTNSQIMHIRVPGPTVNINTDLMLANGTIASFSRTNSAAYYGGKWVPDHTCVSKQNGYIHLVAIVIVSPGLRKNEERKVSKKGLEYSLLWLLVLP